MFPSIHPPGNLQPPSQRVLDDLFEKAHAARIWLGGAAAGKPLGNQQIIELSAADLPLLRDALRLVPDSEPLFCHCRGDLAIELRGRFLKLAVLSYHHAHSLRLEGDYADAQLADGPALLHLLASRGIPQFLDMHKAGQLAAQRAKTVRDAWTEAAPAVLKDKLTPLEVGPMGLPPHESSTVFDDAVGTLRSSGQTDSQIATALLTWLGSANSPWSGFPGYEMVPLALLRRLPHDPVREAILSAKTESTLLGAARFVSDHEVVSFRKRFVRSIPVERFDQFQQRLAHVPLASNDMDDAKARLQRARQVAQTQPKTQPTADDQAPFSCVAESEDGPFGSLATNGSVLCAVDVFSVVRIDLQKGQLTQLTSYAGSPFTDLVMVQERLFAVRPNESRIDEVFLDGSGRREFAVDVARPLQPLAAQGTICFVSAPFEQREQNGVRTSVQRTALCKIAEGRAVILSPIPDAISALAADETGLYFACTNLDRKGTLFRIDSRGGTPTELTKVKSLGDAMATPNMVVLDQFLIYADGNRLMRIPTSGGRPEVLCKAREDISALTVVSDGIVFFTGDQFGPKWNISKVARTGGAAHPIATLSRLPYHRIKLVSAKDAAYFSLEEKIYRVR